MNHTKIEPLGKLPPNSIIRAAVHSLFNPTSTLDCILGITEDNFIKYLETGESEYEFSPLFDGKLRDKRGLIFYENIRR